MTSPFREQRLNPREVRRILRRAAELAESDPATADAERAMTRHELETTAAQLGLPMSAIGAACESGEAPTEQRSGGLLGAPTRIVLEAEVDGEPSESDREDLLETIRDETGETGAIETIGKTFTWRLVPIYGRTRDMSVRFRSLAGRTRIVVEERVTRQAVGLFAGLGAGGGLGPMGAYIAAVAELGPIGLLFPLVWIPVMLLLARTIFMAVARRKERELRRLMDRLTGSAARWKRGEAPRMRVSAARRARVDAEASVDDAEAEAEEAAGEVGRKNARS